MAGYRYGGTEFDAHLPLPEIPKRKNPRNPGTPPPCGTMSGYAWHRRYNETPCDACRATNREYNAEWKRRKKAGKVTTGWLDRCGTVAGYSKHRRTATPVCEPCRAANAAACKERRDMKRAA